MVRRLFRCKRPVRNRHAAKHGRPQLTGDMDFDRAARPHGGGTRDRTQSTGRIPKHGNRGIFDLNAVMNPIGRIGHDRSHRPGKPLEQVNRMDRLIHQRPAAIEFPGAPPIG